MAFNIFRWMTKKTDDENTQVGRNVNITNFLGEDEGSFQVDVGLYIQCMAFWAAVRKIGSAVAAVEWQTIRRGKNVKSSEYWCWNFDPNPNQTCQEFFQQLVAELYLHQQALIIETRKGNRYVAEAFTVAQHIDGDIYSDIVIRGESYPGVFKSSDVMLITLPGFKIKSVLDAVAANNGQMIKSATGNFLRGQGTRGILNISDTAEAQADFEEHYEDLVNEKFKQYFNKANAVLPMWEGFEFKQTETTGGSTKSNLTGSRDIKNMMDDIVEYTAQAFGIPAAMLTGKSATDKDFQMFMTYPVKPIVDAITNEMNRKIYNQKLVFSDTCITPNLAKVKYTDVFDVANPIDKLIGSGAFCVNDVRMRLGLDVIDEDWAWQHWMTKNYSPTEELLEGVDDKSVAPVQQPTGDENKEEEKDEESEE